MATTRADRLKTSPAPLRRPLTLPWFPFVQSAQRALTHADARTRRAMAQRHKPLARPRRRPPRAPARVASHRAPGAGRSGGRAHRPPPSTATRAPARVRATHDTWTWTNHRPSKRALTRAGARMRRVIGTTGTPGSSVPPLRPRGRPSSAPARVSHMPAPDVRVDTPERLRPHLVQSPKRLKRALHVDTTAIPYRLGGALIFENLCEESVHAVR